MMSFGAFLIIALAATASAVEEEFPVLYELEPLYNVLNITGWSSYPDCWIFPQPAITLVYEDATYQIATTADEEDKTKGKLVANAWCQRQGLEKAASFQLSDFSAGTVVRSLQIGSGDICKGTPGKCTGFKFIECVRGTAKAGCGKKLHQLSGTDNNGFGNIGNSNVGNFNNGSANVGDFNLGSANVGSMNTGSADVGSYLTCSACKDAESSKL
ncbi:hypothetical protein F751_3777 [Auxenochlorella protothecoides]|uniref:Uncharacterized protein n=1 Tax=Auxenochlorella protothecoides TaxID=3075 RepID=A0A087SGB1_AUXPR|nr:hypothetical protein F751_3777 [Auxenochlorella protothecoides]KFM24765.1 hypothetical protein F751_3777 [Auxenochlorella protothecoides]RMZ52675.1 hypothetical protein APUTEX25_000794 [Auxenochlorella protothecoides]|eukprot:RMZ52675.1 hypothetical protein APUTEX25_000794 [Auxenochlorella protothecoides]